MYRGLESLRHPSTEQTTACHWHWHTNNRFRMNQPTVEQLDALWRSMSIQQQAFVTELGRTGVSDAAFTLALVLVPTLNFATYKSFTEQDVAPQVGLSLPALTRVLGELVNLKALDVWHRVVQGRKFTQYRLGKALLSGSSAFMDASARATTARGASVQSG